jgi:hypothetical protein
VHQSKKFNKLINGRGNGPSFLLPAWLAGHTNHVHNGSVSQGDGPVFSEMKCLGPEDRHYVIDHHHLARALHDEGVKDVLVTVVKNLRTLEPDSFWFVLDNQSWMHSYDDEGRLRPYKDLPMTVAGLIDDPFRSLAGELRRTGGFAKDTTPFSEFLWADFLRRRVKRETVEAHFNHALEKALELAKGEEASYLPGWCGPVSED